MSRISAGVAIASALDPENPVRYRMLARLVNRSASMRSSFSFFPSAARRCRRLSGICAEPANKSAQGKIVAVRTEPAHDGDCGISERRLTPLGLARIDVRHVHFDERHANSRERVT